MEARLERVRFGRFNDVSQRAGSYRYGGGFNKFKSARCAGVMKSRPTSNEAFIQPKPSVAMYANLVPTLPYSTNTSCEPVFRQTAAELLLQDVGEVGLVFVEQ